MKKFLKRLIIFISIVFLLGIFYVQITKEKYLKPIINIIASKIFKVDLSLDKIERIGYFKFKITHLKVNEVSGENFAVLDTVVVNLNIFAPSRIRNIAVDGGNLKIINYGEKYNFENVMVDETTEYETLKLSNIGTLKLKNLNATYIDKSFKDNVKIDLYNANGYLKTSVNYPFEINIVANKKGLFSKKEETVQLKMLSEPIEKLKNPFEEFISDFYTDINKIKEKNTRINFIFNNVEVDKNYAQYVPIDLITVNSAEIDGDLSILVKNNDEFEFYGDLSATNGNVKYVDYSDNIKDINTKIKFDKDKIYVNAKTNINGSDVALDIKTYLENNKIDIDFDFNELNYKDIRKYELLKNINVDILGKITGKISLTVLDGKLEDLSGKLSSKKLRAYDVNFNNTALNFKLDNDNINVNSIKSKINYSKDNIYFNSDLVGKIKYNMKQNSADINYSLFNVNTIANISKMKGSISYKNDKVILKNRIDNDFVTDLSYNLKTNIANIKNSAKTPKIIKYGDNEIKVLPNINNLVVDVKNMNILSSNVDVVVNDIPINIDLKTHKYDDYTSINTNVNLLDNNFNIDATLDKSLGVNAKINSKNIDVKNLLEKLNIKNDYLDDLPKLDVNLEIDGPINNLTGKYLIESKDYLNNTLEYNNFKISGTFKNENPLYLKLNYEIDDLWYKYHNLKNISGEVTYKDKIINAKLDNENLKGYLSFDTFDKETNLYMELDDYTLYSTFRPDINLKISNMYLNLYGKLDKLNGYLKLNKSPVIIEEVDTGDFNIDIKLKDNVVKIEDISFRDSSIKGEYDITNDKIDIKSVIKESKIFDLLKIGDGNIDINSKINIVGSKDNLALFTDTKLNNLYYKNINLPNIDLNFDYSDFNLKNVFKEGKIKVNDLKVYNNAYEYVNLNYDEIDIKTFYFDNRIENKVIDLSDFNKKGFNNIKGKLIIDADLTGDLENIYSNLYLKTNEVVINDEKLNNIYLDVQASRNGININNIYMEYKDNPFTMDGYFTFKPLDYNIKLLADNINLDFLKINSSITDAGGNANINFLIDKTKPTGDIYIDNFKFKTQNKLVDIGNLVTDINLDGKTININQFTGIINNGTIDIYGRVDIPTIPSDFLETKRLKLGVIDLNLISENLAVSYNDIDAELTTNIQIKDENIDGKLVINKGNIKAVPNFSKSENKKTSYISELTTEIFKKILDQYNVNASLEIETPIKLDIKNYLILQDIKGDINGGVELLFSNGKPIISGKFSLNNSKFLLNKYKFNIENLDIVLNSNNQNYVIDPEINLRANTKIGEEDVEINMTGLLSEKNIEVKSTSGKTKEEILALIALNLTNSKGESLTNYNPFKGTGLIGVALETTLNEFLISRFTNPIQSILGLSDFKIQTNLNSSQDSNINEIFKDTSTTVLFQRKLLEDKNLYFNAELLVPLDFSSNFTDKFKYNMWISQDIFNGFNSNIGIKSSDRIMKTNNYVFNTINIYAGIDYSKKDMNFYDIIESFREELKKKKVLKKVSE